MSGPYYTLRTSSQDGRLTPARLILQWRDRGDALIGIGPAGPVPSAELARLLCPDGRVFENGWPYDSLDRANAPRTRAGRVREMAAAKSDSARAEAERIAAAIEAEADAAEAAAAKEGRA